MSQPDFKPIRLPSILAHLGVDPPTADEVRARDVVLRCPKDTCNMEKIALDDLLIDRCPECTGLWFDAGELERILRMHDDSIIDALDRPDEEIPEHVRFLLADIPCPRDGRAMQLAISKKHPDIEFEICPVCAGIFLDAGELHTLSRKSLLTRLTSLFRL